MRRRKGTIAVIGCLLGLVVAAFAQQQRKPGLWSLTTTMTRANTPAGAPAMPPYTVSVCFTQAMIEKYGAIMPSLPGCKIGDVSVKPGHMTATMVCTGTLNGKGDVESSWTDAEHATGSIHFTGVSGPRQVEWTSRSTAVFQGSDCGAVKPAPMPQ